MDGKMGYKLNKQKATETLYNFLPVLVVLKKRKKVWIANKLDRQEWTVKEQPVTQIE